MSISVVLIASLFGPAPSSDASEIIKNVRASYARLSSYQDTASVTMTHPGGEDRQFFKTWYQRPGRWRMDYSEPRENGKQATLIFWSNGSSNKIWDDVYKRSPNVLRSPGHGFESVSRVACQYVETVPSLLDPTAVNDRTLEDLAGSAILPEAMIKQSECVRINGRGPGQSNVTIWIEKRRTLILRIENETKVQNLGDARIVVDYSPVPNPKIAPSVFEYKPPPNSTRVEFR